VYQRDSHFKRHGTEFGVHAAAEYEAMADAFMAPGPINVDTLDGTRHRKDGDVDYMRMDTVKSDFGVSCLNRNFLRTFYRPTATKIRNRGGAVGFFAFECARVM